MYFKHMTKSGIKHAEWEYNPDSEHWNMLSLLFGSDYEWERLLNSCGFGC